MLRNCRDSSIRASALLGISPKTMEKHRAAIMKRLGAPARSPRWSAVQFDKE
jgi:FixJ family two-component response regulator